MTAPSIQRVLILTPWYPGADNPVAGVFVRETAEMLSEVVDVVVVHVSGFRRRGVRSSTGRSPMVVVRATCGPWPRGIRSLGAAFTALLVARALRRGGFEPDIVYAQTQESAFGAALIGLLHRRPVVVTEHCTVFLPVSPERLSPLRALLVRWAYRRVHVLAVGSALADALRRFAPGCQPQVVPNPVDTETFHPPSHPPDNLVPVAVTTAILHPSKGVSTLIEALAVLRDQGDIVCANVIGDGPERGHLDSLVQRRHLVGEIQLVGRKDKAEVADFLRGADVFVIASQYETSCVAATEALCTGLPVVATRSGGPEDYVDGSNGALVPVGDVPALTRVIRQVLGRPVNREAVAANAAARFGRRVIREELVRQFHAAAAAGPPGLRATARRRRQRFRPA